MENTLRNYNIPLDVSNCDKKSPSQYGYKRLELCINVIYVLIIVEVVTKVTSKGVSPIDYAICNRDLF